MSKEKAFPYIGSIIDKQFGMDLRDYFAAAAMPALINEDLSKLQEEYDLKRTEMISILAYKYADSMMEARKK